MEMTLPAAIEGYAQEAKSLERHLDEVHELVFGGFWLRRLLPIPGLLRHGDYEVQAASLRHLEERLRLIRLACMGEAGEGEVAILTVTTYADTLHATITALRRIVERLYALSYGVRYDMDEFAADVERYNVLLEAHRNLRLMV